MPSALNGMKATESGSVFLHMPVAAAVEQPRVVGVVTIDSADPTMAAVTQRKKHNDHRKLSEQWILF